MEYLMYLLYPILGSLIYLFGFSMGKSKSTPLNNTEHMVPEVNRKTSKNDYSVPPPATNIEELKKQIDSYHKSMMEELDTRHKLFDENIALRGQLIKNGLEPEVKSIYERTSWCQRDIAAPSNVSIRIGNPIDFIADVVIKECNEQEAK